MEVRQKVSTLQEPVAGQDRFVTGAWSPDGCIVTDGDTQGRSEAAIQGATNAIDQSVFARFLWGLPIVLG